MHEPNKEYLPIVFREQRAADVYRTERKDEAKEVEVESSRAESSK